MEKVFCKKCGAHWLPAYKLKFFANPQRKKIYDPKYCFHIQSRCGNCEEFIKNEEQTAELINYLNESQGVAGVG